MSTLRPAEPGGKRITGVGVLDRSVGLLDLLADGPRTLRWLADASGLPRPTAYRLLVALEAHRLVARDATGAFGLGPRLAELAVRAGPALDLAAVAGPVLAGLHEATGESVQLYVRSGDRRLCVAARDAWHGPARQRPGRRPAPPRRRLRRQGPPGLVPRRPPPVVPRAVPGRSDGPGPRVEVRWREVALGRRGAWAWRGRRGAEWRGAWPGRAAARRSVGR